MGIFNRKSAAQRQEDTSKVEEATKEDEKKKLEEELKQKRALEAAEVRKAMEVKQRVRRESEEIMSQGMPDLPPQDAKKSKINRHGGASSTEVAELNAQIAKKKEEAKQREIEKKRKAEEELQRKKAAALEADDDDVDDAAGAAPILRASGYKGSAAERLAAMQREKDAAMDEAYGTAQPRQSTVGGKPTRQATVAEKNAARSAAFAANGVFLSFEDNLQREQRLDTLTKKVADLEKKRRELEGGTIRSKMRRMSNAAAALVGAGGGSSSSSSFKKDKPMSKEDAELMKTVEDFHRRFSGIDADMDSAAQEAVAAANAAAAPGPTEAAAPANPSPAGLRNPSPGGGVRGKMRRMSNMMFGGKNAPTAPMVQPTTTTV